MTSHIYFTGFIYEYFDILVESQVTNPSFFETYHCL